MGLFRPSREHYGPDPYYNSKVILFAIGAGFGLAAMVTGRDWLIWIAVPTLAVGVALRWLRRKPAGEEDEEEEEEEGPASPAHENRATSPSGAARPPEIPPPT